jgi:hypothetical protein
VSASRRTSWCFRQTAYTEIKKLEASVSGVGSSRGKQGSPACTNLGDDELAPDIACISTCTTHAVQVGAVGEAQRGERGKAAHCSHYLGRHQFAAEVETSLSHT